MKLLEFSLNHGKIPLLTSPEMTGHAAWLCLFTAAALCKIYLWSSSWGIKWSIHVGLHSPCTELSIYLGECITDNTHTANSFQYQPDLFFKGLASVSKVIGEFALTHTLDGRAHAVYKILSNMFIDSCFIHFIGFNNRHLHFFYSSLENGGFTFGFSNENFF